MAKRKPEEKLNGMAISDTSIRQPVFIVMMMLLVVTFGLLAFRTMPVNLLPDFEVPVIAVTVAYPGAGPESVADQVAKPIEDAVNTLNGIKHITSTSSEGIAFIILEFTEGTDVDQADLNVREKVNSILPTLPRDIRDPIYQKFDPNQAPIMSVAVGANAAQSPLELRRIIDDELVPRLQRVQGVGSVNVTGGQTRQINVLMDLDKLRSYQILPAQITRSLQQANANLGLGTITTGAQDISLRAPSLLQTPQDIAKIQITGTSYRISDVATVQDGVAETVSYSRLNGNEAIILDIRKQSGTNTVQVAEGVKAELTRIFADRNDLSYIIPRDDSTSVVSSTISSLEELIFAAIAAFIVVFIFFRDLRNTAITMAGLPVIIIGTFAIMPFFGLTVNLITLLALSLCVGLVIDDAIVVRENIFRHTQRGETPKVAASKGTTEVSLSVLAMTLTIVAVFVPVTFAQGTAGIIFKSFGIVVAIAILLSLVEAFTFAPMLSANFFKRQKVKAQTHDASHSHGNEIMQAATAAGADDEHNASLLHEATEDPGWLGRRYERLLGWSLRNIWTRLMVVAVAVGVLVASFYVASGLKFSFFPMEEPRQFIMGYQLPPGTTLDETNRVALQAEQIILSDPGIESAISSVGFSGNPERAEFFVKLRDEQYMREAESRLRPQLGFLPQLVFARPVMGGQNNTGVTGRQLQLSLQTTRPIEEIAPVLDQIQATAQSVPGLVDIDTNYRPGKTELRFVADPTRIGDLGITNDDIASSVRALINGERATVLRQQGDDTDVVVRLRPQDRSSPEDLRGIIIPTRSGPVPLSALGAVEISTSPNTIRRYDRLNQAIVGANLAPGRNLSEAQRDLQSKVDGAGLPADITATFVGQAQQQTEGFGSLLLAMGLSVLFVYMVLASQFGSYMQPLVIMVAMPFSFIGAFLALRFTGLDLDITGMIGLIMLLGLVVKNSILLVDFTNRLRKAGLQKHAALELAGAIRLRPILMTTFALVAGALPVAMGIHVIGTGEGGEFRKGLATVLIGGLLTSMFLTLLVVPTAYSLVDSLTTRVARLFRRSDEDDDEMVLQPAPVLATATAAPAGGVPVAAATNGAHGASNGHSNGGNGTNGASNGQEVVPSKGESQETKEL